MANEKNVMRQIRIEKVTLNAGCGDDPQRIEKSKKLFEMLTDQEIVTTRSKKRSKFGVPKGKPLGVTVTLRNEKAEELLKQVFLAAGNKMKDSNIDKQGNFSIGVKEYIDLPNVQYQHEIGMLGFDVSVTLERPGFHIKKRRIEKRKIGKGHKINKEETINWLKERFGVQVE